MNFSQCSVVYESVCFIITRYISSANIKVFLFSQVTLNGITFYAYMFSLPGADLLVTCMTLWTLPMSNNVDQEMINFWSKTVQIFTMSVVV